MVLDSEATGFWPSVTSLAAAGSGLGLGEAEGGNKETTGSSAFISPWYSQLQVSNLISAASCFLRCLAVPRHPLTCHQPREKGRVGGRMGVGAPPVWVPRLRPRGHTRPAGPPAVHLGCLLRGRWAQPAGGWGEMMQTPTRGPANSSGSCAP